MPRITVQTTQGLMDFEFPEGTAPEKVNTAVQQKLAEVGAQPVSSGPAPEPDIGAGTEFARGLGRGTANVATNVLMGLPEMAVRGTTELMRSTVADQLANQGRMLNRQMEMYGGGIPEQTQERISQGVEGQFSEGVRANPAAALPLWLGTEGLGQARHAIQGRVQEAIPPSNVVQQTDLSQMPWSQLLDPRDPVTQRILLSSGGESLPYMGLGLGAGLASGGAGAGAYLGGALGGTTEAVTIYDEAKQQGMSEAEALRRFLGAAVATSALEGIGLDAILKKLPPSITGKFLKAVGSGVVEGTTETLQEFIQASLSGADLEQAAKEGALGGMLGIAMGGAAGPVFGGTDAQADAVPGQYVPQPPPGPPGTPPPDVPVPVGPPGGGVQPPVGGQIAATPEALNPNAYQGPDGAWYVWPPNSDVPVRIGPPQSSTQQVPQQAPQGVPQAPQAAPQPSTQQVPVPAPEPAYAQQPPYLAQPPSGIPPAVGPPVVGQPGVQPPPPPPYEQVRDEMALPPENEKMGRGRWESETVPAPPPDAARQQAAKQYLEDASDMDLAQARLYAQRPPAPYEPYVPSPFEVPVGVTPPYVQQPPRGKQPRASEPPAPEQPIPASQGKEPGAQAAPAPQSTPVAPEPQGPPSAGPSPAEPPPQAPAASTKPRDVRDKRQRYEAIQRASSVESSGVPVILSHAHLFTNGEVDRLVHWMETDKNVDRPVPAEDIAQELQIPDLIRPSDKREVGYAAPYEPGQQNFRSAPYKREGGILGEPEQERGTKAQRNILAAIEAVEQKGTRRDPRRNDLTRKLGKSAAPDLPAEEHGVVGEKYRQYLEDDISQEEWDWFIGDMRERVANPARAASRTAREAEAREAQAAPEKKRGKRRKTFATRDEVDPSGASPVVGMYMEEKREAGDDSVLLVRWGDFYEAMFEDAEALSGATGISLTSRNEEGKPVAMAGFPVAQADRWVQKLADAGYTATLVDEPGAEAREAQAAPEGVRAAADQIEAMDPDVRDNTEVHDMPGGRDAHALWEARQFAKKEGKPVRVAGKDTFSLKDEFHSVVKVGDRYYGLTKDEDPDSESLAIDKYGFPREFVWSYRPLDSDTDRSMREPMVSDTQELIDIIRAEQRLEGGTNAEAVRANAEQVREAGDVRREGEDQGGEDLQRDEEARGPVPAPRETAAEEGVEPHHNAYEDPLSKSAFTAKAFEKAQEFGLVKGDFWTHRPDPSGKTGKYTLTDVRKVIQKKANTARTAEEFERYSDAKLDEALAQAHKELLDTKSRRKPQAREERDLILLEKQRRQEMRKPPPKSAREMVEEDEALMDQEDAEARAEYEGMSTTDLLDEATRLRERLSEGGYGSPNRLTLQQEYDIQVKLDAVNALLRESEGRLYSMGQPGEGMAASEAEAQVAPMRKRWRNGPSDVRVVQSEGQVPENLRREGMRGVYDPETDTVWVVADNLDPAHDAAFVTAHEVIGHRGIEAVLGKEADSFFAGLAAARAREVRQYADEMGYGFTTPKERRTAAREWLADRVAAGDLDPTVQNWWKRLRTKLKNALLRITGRFNWTETQLQQLASASREWSQTGTTPTEILKRDPYFALKPLRVRLKIAELVEAAQIARTAREWYKECQETIEEMFGDYAPLFKDFLAATSPMKPVGVNVSEALKAMDQWFRGQEFEGFMPSVVTNLERALRGEDLSGKKVRPFQRALHGDPEGIAIDRHMAQLMFNRNSPTDRQIRLAQKRCRQVANELGWTPAEAQAALWAYNQVRKGKDIQDVEQFGQELRRRADLLEALSASWPADWRTAETAGKRLSQRRAAREQARIEQRRAEREAAGETLWSMKARPIEGAATGRKQTAQERVNRWRKRQEPEARGAVAALALGTLRKRRAKTAAAYQRANRWQSALSPDQLEDIGAYREGIGRLTKPGDTFADVKKRMTAEMRRVLNEYAVHIEQERQAINSYLKELGEDEYIQYIEDYLPHFYVGDTRRRREFVNRWIKNSPNAKKRKLPTLEDAMKGGLKPVTQDVAVLYKMYSSLNWRVATNKMFAEKLPTIRLQHTRPEDIDPRNPTEMFPSVVSTTYKPGWVKMDHPALNRAMFRRGLKKGETIREFNPVYVHPDIAGPVRQVLDGPWRNGWTRAIETFNATSKRAMLSLSLFHHMALTESGNSVLGRWYNPIRGLVLIGEDGKLVQRPHKKGLNLLENAKFLEDAIGHGLQISHTSDHPVDRTNRQLARLETALSGVPVLGTAARRLRQGQQWWDTALWDRYHTGLKALGYYEAVNEFLKDNDTATPEEIEVAKEKAARHINDAFGGQEWESHMWLSPKARQMFHWAMLAPDWTVSNARIFSETFHQAHDPQLRKLQLRYWRNMAVTLAGTAMAFQYAIYQAFGDDEENDNPFPWQNEAGKEWDIDITPLLRAYMHATGRELEGRRYTHFGKQAREVMGWLTEPFKTGFGKASPAVHTATEQILGVNGLYEGEVFTTDWVRKDKQGLSMVGSRLKAVGEKFVPFAFRDNNFAWTAPMNKGMTPFKGQMAITRALEAYADPGVIEGFKGTPNYERKLDRLVEDILDAMERNDVDAEQVLKYSLGEARSKYYREFLDALEDEDYDKLERLAEPVIRLHAGIDNLRRSAEARGIDLGPEQRGAMSRAVSGAKQSVQYGR